MKKMKSKDISADQIYYDVGNDIERYPDAWCYIVIGGRNTGKTYGSLKYYEEKNLPIVFIKRTNNDVDMLCAGNHLGDKSKEYSVDLSPYKSINRDLGTNIKAYKMDSGLAVFCETDEEKGAIGVPVGYLLSLNAVHKFKGFDLSECSAIIFDEFIPQPWERVNRKEGEQLLEIYKTISRDRELRGREELKLICLANAVDVYNNTCEILELTDVISQMNISGQEIYYNEERGIFIRMLKTSEAMKAANEKTGVYRAMKGTAWAEMAFENEFGYNDFTLVKKVALKGYRPLIELTYKQKKLYIYNNECYFYMCHSPGKCQISYDLNREMDQRAFYLDHGIDLLNATTRGLMQFEKYSYYDLIVNFKARFKLK